MEAVVYSTFRNNLKDYMKKVNDEFEPLIVVNKNPDENIVVLSQESWESLQETIRMMENDYLSHKVIDGMLQVKEKQTLKHHLIEVEDV
ncbi:type II toxin-antitoxin system prevent-host-death family antitoxin [Streptococcus didelphis]|uniref:Antitoxin n=1 Tax=Streptococcus didelphis TaxID=102886 RepID=A0ABY9LIB3_9STRE|nr:type II toxin-antitoxin system prevent-host-death family antitoxin [Streptococcus didelphis]WMB27851.1 type II toxin-antitoxin system prevent-host-death family antitoxin [Streptococcus didelphis]WMB29687.1 type II toxin-antitoxin system prevent-host-death family antitoxin [Streptococcus didelphis]